MEPASEDDHVSRETKNSKDEEDQESNNNDNGADEDEEDDEEDDEDNDVESEEEEAAHFTALSTRRLGKPMQNFRNLCALCPSMDLVAVGLGQGSAVETVQVHRSMSWQKLLGLGPSELTVQNPSLALDQLIPPQSDTSTNQGASCLAWSPDGRALAVGMASGQLHIYHVESTGATLVHVTSQATFQLEHQSIPAKQSPTNIAMSPIMTRSRTAARRRQQHQQQLPKQPTSSLPLPANPPAPPLKLHLAAPQDSHVVGLYWAKRIMHPLHRRTLFKSLDEDEMEETWEILKQFLDRPFLPGPIEDTNRASMNGTCGLPSSIAPLSVLCVAGVCNSLSVYLHGRYPILTTAPPFGNSDPTSTSSRIVCAPDLSSIAVAPCSGHCVYLYSTPHLALRQHDLTWISSSFSTISANLLCIHQALQDLPTTWTNIFRPLEAKWSSLKELLDRYGVDSLHLSSVLVVGLGSGSKEGAPEAIVQFLCSLNEHALQRMLKNLESSIASVESTLRRNVVAPAQALVYSASEMLSLSQSMSCYLHDFPNLLQETVASQALAISETLYQNAELCVRDVVLMHLRIRDLVRWLIWEVLCAKADNTPIDSPEHGNARAKRPPQAVLDRVTHFLYKGDMFESKNPALCQTEVIVGLHVSEHFTTNADVVPNASTQSSLGTVLLAAKSIFCTLFEEPRNKMNASIDRKAFKFTSKFYSTPIALHRRFGLEDTTMQGGFRPAGDIGSPTRNWILMAHVQNRDSSSMIQIVAIKSLNEDLTPPSHYLTAFIVLPDNYNAIEVIFYGDDGNSALDVLGGAGGDPTPERRQYLVLLVSDENDLEHLWLVDYDKAQFRTVEFSPSSSSINLVEKPSHNDKISKITFKIDDEEDAIGLLNVKRRALGTKTSEKGVRENGRVVSSGSRGIVGVLNHLNSLALYDVEEDEDNDDCSESDDDDESMQGAAKQ